MYRLKYCVTEMNHTVISCMSIYICTHARYHTMQDIAIQYVLCSQNIDTTDIPQYDIEPYFHYYQMALFTHELGMWSSWHVDTFPPWHGPYTTRKTAKSQEFQNKIEGRVMRKPGILLFLVSFHEKLIFPHPLSIMVLKNIQEPIC